ncbi:MAG: ATP-binding cassette domain-containing protein [Miltoncostaeaceae bacterium]
MTAPAVETHDLVREYKGGVRAVDGVTLTVGSGGIFGFLGPNGAGKSTTVRMLTTLLRPTAGTARVAGHDVQENPDAVRRRIGVALQDAAIDPYMTGRELLRLQGVLHGLPRAECRARADDLLDRVGLEDAADRRVGTYSGGMRRRLDLALSLVHEPVVLFLDEPTTGLDPTSRVALWEEVRRLNREHGTTIFLTTQYLEEADRLAQRIAVIDRGVVIAEGTPAELKARVGGEGLEVAVVEPGDLERARTIVSRVASDEVFVDPERRRVRAAVADGPRALADVAGQIAAEGILTEDVGLHRPTLDEVFLALTGRPAEDDDGAAAMDEGSG